MEILVINPGSTSTKIAIFEEETVIYSETIHHEPADLAPFSCVLEQLDYRKGLILAALDKAGYALRDLDAVSGRGGFMKHIPSGTYRVTDAVVENMHAPMYEHAANLGPLLARELADAAGIPAFFVDPVSVDEITDVARVTGLAGMERESFFHCLNHKGVARKAAKELGKTYETCNLVVCHLGGGVTSAAHQKGRAVDVTNVFDEGCFSMDRGGALPTHQLVDLCFSGRSKEEIVQQLSTGGGVVSYLGTRDFRTVQRMALEEGNALAKRVFDAMVYQLSKDIAALSSVMCMDVDAIILTGGMAYSQVFCDAVEARVGKIAPVLRYPGEMEMLSLAQGALRVLHGEEEPGIF